MTNVLTAIFETHTEAARAIESLAAAGFGHDEISFVASDEFDVDSFGVETHSKLPEGAAIGAGAGGALGAVVAGLTLIGAVGSGGLGLIAAGPLVAALAGAGAGAAGGSVVGGLIGLAIPEHEVKHYEEALENGHVLVGVECETSEQRKTVKDIFERCNARKLSHA
tara:strand:+ start:17720 stop:18217 length:498 start_codon:yes stop_codon:yes gene_type:complete